METSGIEEIRKLECQECGARIHWNQWITSGIFEFLDLNGKIVWIGFEVICPECKSVDLMHYEFVLAIEKMENLCPN